MHAIRDKRTEEMPVSISDDGNHSVLAMIEVIDAIYKNNKAAGEDFIGTKLIRIINLYTGRYNQGNEKATEGKEDRSNMSNLKIGDKLNELLSN